jgi:2-polyprenyl-3-methyl-5-hydroxy-6-metoxy-1,4-benzoquinol methylase
MASIEQNKQWWNESEWSEAGNEWSSAYGTPEMQWYASILPRIHRYLPAATILEIAPGFGRWTHFLKAACCNLVLVDLSAKCIEACKERFAGEKHIAYHLNDGRSLAMVADCSIDFMFSFDSLVHVEKDVIQAYLEQIATKLTPDGVGFIHHSNIGEFAKYFETLDHLPRGRGLLSRLQLVEPGDHKRARSMTADVFLDLATKAGLKVVSQELVNWGTQRTIDCISVFTLPNGTWDRDYQRWVNEDFGREAQYIGQLAALYDRPAPKRPV